MKVRNATSSTLLIPGQRFLAPGPDFVAVKENDDVRFLIDAGALELSKPSVQNTDDPKENA